MEFILVFGNKLIAISIYNDKLLYSIINKIK